MTLTFKNLYIATAVTSAVIYVFPFLALLGLVLWPMGLVLAWAPAALLYLSLWWVLKTGLSAVFLHSGLGHRLRYSNAWSNGIAAIVLGVAAFAVPSIANLETHKLVASLQAGDIEGSEPVRIQDIATLEQPIYPGWHSEEDVPCIWICQRLLQDGIARVVRVEAKGTPGFRSTARAPFAPVAFTLENRAPCPRTPLSSLGGGQRQSDSALCIVSTDAPTERGVTIRFQDIKKAGATEWAQPWSLAADTIAARRIEIFDADGSLLFRRTRVTSTPLRIPLMTAAGAGILTTVTYVGWARTKVIAGGTNNGRLGYDVLPKVLDLPGTPKQRPVLGE